MNPTNQVAKNHKQRDQKLQPKKPVGPASRRTSPIRVWFSKEEYARLTAVAKALGLFKTDIIRLAIYKAMVKPGEKLEPRFLGPTGRRLANLASGAGQAVTCALKGEGRGVIMAAPMGKGGCQ